ncbi:MAG: RCC1 repeat-containing protein [Bdellovibrionales bacterium]|nr:RCC1 repeat-containing protein [Bdellovibrionales bacterium]
MTDIDTSEAGYGFTCAVHLGAAKCWGGNFYGQLGNNSTVNSRTPVSVVGLSSGVIGITTGEHHACALISDGTIKCWGRNDRGQFGDGTTTDSLIPVSVSGILDGATKITAGRYNTCAIVSGRAKCWGSNGSGQLGDGTNTQSLVPVDVLGLTSGVVDVAISSDSSIGYAVACAIDSLGAVRCWGSNAEGQLGDGTILNRNSPVYVQGLTGQFIQVSVSPGTACALRNDGKSYCWGDWTSGQAGNNKAGFNNHPQEPLGLGSGVTSFGAGNGFGCAIQSGALKCWGSNSSGQLGNGATAGQSTPVQVVGLTSGVTQVSQGGDTAHFSQHSCAVINGAAKCWGNNSVGQLGNGAQGGYSSTPVQVVGLTSGVLSVAATFQYSCAVLVNGGIKCWGDNSYGQLGNNSTIDSLVPVVVVGILNATDVAVGADHACAIDGGAMKCWGNNNAGQLGDNSLISSLIPVVPIGMESGVSAIAISSYSTESTSCGVVNGSAKCWGYGMAGRLGTGSTANQRVPTQVVGFTSGVKKNINVKCARVFIDPGGSYPLLGR